jgi:hypothetical protein
MYLFLIKFGKKNGLSLRTGSILPVFILVLLSKFIYNRHFRLNAYDETNMSPHQYFLKYQIIHAKASKRLDGNGSAKYQIIVKKKKMFFESYM